VVLLLGVGKDMGTREQVNAGGPVLDYFWTIGKVLSFSRFLIMFL
jgi:hypothetical protein